MGTVMLALELGGSVGGLLLVLLPLGAAVLLAYGVAQVALDLRGSSRKQVMSRLKGGASEKASRGADLADPLDLRKKAVDTSGLLTGLFARLQFTKRLQRTLEQADVRMSAPQLMVNLTAVASILTAVLLLVGLPPLAGLGVAAAVYLLPILYLVQRRKSRMKKLVQQLPDVFELLSQALRAGHSLASGMQLIARQVPAPGGVEFGRVFHEQNLGLKVEDALRNLADRTDMLDVRFFVTAVLIQRQTGGDLAEVLDKIGGVIRDRIKLHGTVQALTAEGRLSGYVLLALPPIMFVVLQFLNPAYGMKMITDPTGRMMLVGAGISQLMGWMLIKKIVNIKV